MELPEEELLQTLATYWGYREFRPYQLQIIQAILGKRDALVLMATGSGKSLCFQIPIVALRDHGCRNTVVVVSPLISLMEDQVESLKRTGIEACIVGGTASKGRVSEQRALQGDFPIIYITPEKAAVWDDGLAALHKNAGIAFFAIDESHCVSEWGHDFRPEYSQLSRLRELFPEVPFMALTATATPRVQDEIIRNLRMRCPLIVKTTFNRPNLRYVVEPKTNLLQDLNRAFQIISGAAIIYVITKKEAECIAALLRQKFGIKADYYHGDLSLEERRRVHYGFTRDEIRVVVATVAFGMGIDKPDVRLVVHYGLSKSIEGYYQQTGRAGRDGLPSACIMFFNRSDVVKLSNLLDTSETRRKQNLKMLELMVEYASSSDCRREHLLRYFGEAMSSKCEGCDNCERKRRQEEQGASAASGSLSLEEYNKAVKLVMSVLKKTKERFGHNLPISIIRGSETKQVKEKCREAPSWPEFGAGKDKSEDWWKAFFHQLVEREKLLEAHHIQFQNRSYPLCKMTLKGRKFLDDPSAKLLVFTPTRELYLAETGMRKRKAQEKLRQQDVNRSSSDVGLSENKPQGEDPLVKQLELRLLATRKELADKLGISAYHVIGEKTIYEMAKLRPSSTIKLAKIEGWPVHKIRDFGPPFIEKIVETSKELGLELDIAPIFLVASSKETLGSIGTAQQESYNDFMVKGKSLEEIAFERIPRAITVKTVKGHLSTCADHGNPLAWDRLGIPTGSEALVGRAVEAFEAKGQDVLQVGFHIRPIMEWMQATDPTGAIPSYEDLRLLLAKIRMETEGTSPSTPSPMPASIPVPTSTQGGWIKAQGSRPSLENKRTLPWATSISATNTSNVVNLRTPQYSSRPSNFFPGNKISPDSPTQKRVKKEELEEMRADSFLTYLQAYPQGQTLQEIQRTWEPARGTDLRSLTGFLEGLEGDMSIYRNGERFCSF